MLFQPYSYIYFAEQFFSCFIYMCVLQTGLQKSRIHLCSWDSPGPLAPILKAEAAPPRILFSVGLGFSLAPVSRAGKITSDGSTTLLSSTEPAVTRGAEITWVERGTPERRSLYQGLPWSGNPWPNISPKYFVQNIILLEDEKQRKNSIGLIVLRNGWFYKPTGTLFWSP